MGNLRQKKVCFCIVINMAAVMIQSVADNQIINFQDHVIPGYLIKYCLRDFYMWSFVFHNQFGTQIFVVEHSNQDLDERKKDLEAKKSELEEIVSETKQEEEKLREKAKVLETTIEPRLLQAFKRIRKNSRNGLGIVYVQRDACGGCFNKIPPQKQLDIRMRKKIIVCEYCGRIMIDPELAGVIAEQHLETVKR